MFDDLQTLAVNISQTLDNTLQSFSQLSLYNGSDWKKYILFNEEKYQRSLVFRNHNIEIFVISWNKNQGCNIHDHPEGGCLVRVMSGELEEVCYMKNNDLMVPYQRNILKKDMIGYQEGKNGLHTIKNINQKEGAVSLHIYSPPHYQPKFYKN